MAHNYRTLILYFVFKNVFSTLTCLYFVIFLDINNIHRNQYNAKLACYLCYLENINNFFVNDLIIFQK